MLGSWGCPKIVLVHIALCSIEGEQHLTVQFERLQNESVDHQLISHTPALILLSAKEAIQRSQNHCSITSAGVQIDSVEQGRI